VGGLLLLGVAAAFLANRAGVPLLVAFLGIGMLLGSDGPGGIDFTDADLARAAGVAGLVAILFEGGLTTAWRDIRGVLGPASILSTAGVGITAALAGLVAYGLFDLPLTGGFLVGAVVASTDAAAVFATLRFTTLRRRLGGLLEAESGLNDPTAVALTVGLIAWLGDPAYGVGDLTLLLVRQIGLGLAVGMGIGFLASRAFVRFPPALSAFAPVASLGIAGLSYGVADVAEGSGFLAVYIVGLWLGNTATPLRRPLAAFHEGVAFVAQVVLFVVLGLLVFPSQLGAVVLPGLALAGALAVVARPVAVWLCTLGQGFSGRERLFLSWAGLRGAVPIVLATFALSEGVTQSNTIFNAVFFVVLVSATLQGPTLGPLARRLGLAGEAHALYQPPIEVGAVRGADIVEYEVDAGDAVEGRRVRELGLPRTALVAVIVREAEAVPPRGRTQVCAGDRLYVLVRAEDRKAVEDRFGAWREGPLADGRPASPAPPASREPPAP
jgi:potassium/hydrogen antiporter